MIDDCLTHNDNLIKCYRCHNDLRDKEWESDWNPGHHYKKITCDCCGHKIWVRVDFEGSGHDDWKPKEEPDLKDPLHSPQMI